MSFEITALPEKWQDRWQKAGFDQPSLIQGETYQLLAKGNDVLGISPTGSGKTLAYLLPLLQKVQAGEGMQLLILTASQELAMQVVDVAREWAADLELKVQSLIGGANLRRQIEKLKEKPEVLIGTPGRVGELMQQKKVKSHQISMLVLDEADQLLQEKLTMQVIKAVGKQSQFSFFSATGDVVAEKIKNMRSDVQVVDVSQQDQSTAQLKHYFLKTPQRKRVDELRRLANIQDFQGLIFFNELSDLGNAEEKLAYHQLPVASLASDQNKMLRKAALTKFREGSLALLLATDVAARGLDIADLPYVVNFDLPLTEESYLHRSGRTGRMGKSGSVLTLVHDGNLKQYELLMEQLKFQPQEIFLYDGNLHTVEKAANDSRQISRPKKTKKKKKNKK